MRILPAAILAALLPAPLPVLSAEPVLPAEEGDKGAAPPARPQAPRAARAGPRWVSLGEGLEVVRKEYRPLLIVFRPSPQGPEGAGAQEAGPGGGGLLEDWEACLRDSSLRKVLERFACVELTTEAIEKAYPLPASKQASKKQGEAPGPAAGADPRPVVRERLGLVSGVPAILVCDFREQVAHRWQEKLPRPSQIRAELTRFARRTEVLAAAARPVEKTLERSEYALGLGETREAVLPLVPLDDVRSRQPLDSVLSGRVAALIERLKKDANQALAGGESLEREKRYLEAIEAYRKVGERYPFTDILKLTHRRQGEAWRKARMGL